MRSTPRRIRVGLLAIGAKGLGLAQDLSGEDGPAEVRFVVTYEPRRTREPGVAAFREAMGPLGIPVIEAGRPDVPGLMATHGEVDLLLHAGWQRLSTGSPVTEVVLHDSLLPRLRGFNPTVTALIEGHARIGVTAFLPVPEVDAGPILSQHGVDVRHPMTIAEAFAALRPCYAAAATDVIHLMEAGSLQGEAQDGAGATYSLWRDEQDYRLDLSVDAERVVRTVLALGHPYLGAVVMLDERPLRVLAAETVEDVLFEGRQPGKVWWLDARGPVVVCGTGMVRFTRLVDGDGAEVRIDRLRVRFT